MSREQKDSPPLSSSLLSRLQVEVTRRREREESSPPSTILFCSTHVYDDEGFCAVAGEAVVMLPFIQQGKDKEEGKDGEKTKKEKI